MIIKQLNVDLWQKILQPITVVQHEASGRTLAITLTGGGLPVNLTNCDVIFYAQKPDGNILFNDCDVIDEATGAVEYTITEQTVVVSGVLKCWIVVIKEGSTVRSQEFNITVQESPDFTEAVESTSEFTDLEVALATLAAYDGRLSAAEGDIVVLGGRMDTAEEDIDAAESDIVDLKTGWIPANEEWVYASATTITVPSGAASRYQVGDKIKLTQTTVKYFSVVGVADTMLTVTGGSGFTVANAEITDNYYSKVENPHGFPRWFNYTPTYGASGSMTYTSVTTSYAQFRIIGGGVFLKIRALGTTGGSASNYLTASIPFVAYTGIGGSGAVLFTDSGVGGGFGHMDGSNANFRIYKNDASNWGLGATRGFWLDAFYSVS